MEDILRDVEECDVYIDDIGCFDSSWESHLRTLERFKITDFPSTRSNVSGA
jgi:hypothetical protein